MILCAVVHLGQVVEGPGLLGVGQQVGPATVGDLDEALFDVDVGRPVLAHGAQLDQVDRGVHLGDGVEEVERPHHVVHLGVDGVLLVDHRVGGGALLGEVHHRVGCELPQDPGREPGVSQVTDEGLHGQARDLAPDPHPVLEARDGDQRVDPHLQVVAPAGEVVDDADVVAPAREVQRRGPAQVTIAPQNQDPHPPSPFCRASRAVLSCRARCGRARGARCAGPSAGPWGPPSPIGCQRQQIRNKGDVAPPSWESAESGPGRPWRCVRGW